MLQLKKTFVLDTNVLLQTPYALYSFGDNTIVIPEVVLEELDKFKKENTELGANARHAARILDDLREKGSLNKGVKLENGGTLRVELNYSNVQIPESWDDSNNDNRILKLCKGLQEDKENVFSDQRYICKNKSRYIRYNCTRFLQSKYQSMTSSIGEERKYIQPKRNLMIFIQKAI